MTRICPRVRPPRSTASESALQAHPASNASSRQRITRDATSSCSSEPARGRPTGRDRGRETGRVQRASRRPCIIGATCSGDRERPAPSRRPHGRERSHPRHAADIKTPSGSSSSAPPASHDPDVAPARTGVTTANNVQLGHRRQHAQLPKSPPNSLTSRAHRPSPANSHLHQTRTAPRWTWPSTPATRTPRGRPRSCTNKHPPSCASTSPNANRQTTITPSSSAARDGLDVVAEHAQKRNPLPEPALVVPEPATARKIIGLLPTGRRAPTTLNRNPTTSTPHGRSLKHQVLHPPSNTPSRWPRTP